MNQKSFVMAAILATTALCDIPTPLRMLRTRQRKFLEQDTIVQPAQTKH